MTGFNFKSLIQVAFVALALTACVKAGKHHASNGDGFGDVRQTNFRFSDGGPVVDVSGYAANLIQSDDIAYSRIGDVSVIDPNNANYSNKREYSLSLCGLVDMNSKGALLGQKMRIYSELPIQNPDVEVRGSGNCVYWQISLPFNYFADSVNLMVNFVFVTTAGPGAFIHKTVLFNPWDARRGSNREFWDYTRFGISEDLRKLRSAIGPKEINLALQGKLVETEKRLEIASLSISPVDRRVFAANNIGAALQTDVAEERKANEERRKAEFERENLAKADLSKDERAAYETFQSLDLMLNIKLSGIKVRLKDSANVNKDEELTTGRYRVYAQLAATDVGGYVLITDQMIISDEKTWKTNTMGVNAVLPLSVVIRPQWGNLNLILKVVPVDIPGVQPFEALYNLGKFTEIAKGNSPMFATDSYTLNPNDGSLTFSTKEYIENASNYKEWLAGRAAEGIEGNTLLEKGFRRFQFTSLNVLFSRIMAGDTATDRTIQYTVETCVIDNTTGARPGAGLLFHIETDDRNVTTPIDRYTNELGCLNWVGMISHKVYHRENLVRKWSKLVYKGEDGKDLVYNLDYYINPWDEKFTFGRDSRILPAEYIKQVTEQQKIAPPTRILLTDFKYDATGFRYVIDKYMNMTVRKTVLMTLHPKILKYNSIVWGRSGFSEVRDGIYLMKIAMEKDYLDPAAPGRHIYLDEKTGRHKAESSEGEAVLSKRHFLVVKEMLVRVLGGLIVTPVEFDLTDLRTLRIRSQMLIQIETIDETLLRAAVLANGKLKGLLNNGTSKTTSEIMSAQLKIEELDAKLDEAKKLADQLELEKTVKQLQTEQSDLKLRIESLLSSLDPAAAKSFLDSIEALRKLGQWGTAVDQNLKFQTINRMLKRIADKRIANEVDYVSKQLIDNAKECDLKAQSLTNQGRTAEAKLYMTGEGNICFRNIPQDELFYHLSSGNMTNEDALLSLFTNDNQEFELFRNGGLRDDFTSAYVPDYDFSLLSNQGDELAKDANGNQVNPDFTSGLPRRTFIGPVTFVLNGNSSAMRPTDVLDEDACRGTCEQLKDIELGELRNSPVFQEVTNVKDFSPPVNSAYEESPYFGSIKQFYGKQVNDLIAMEKGLRHHADQEAKAFSQFGNFVETFDLDYVSFANKPAPLKKLDMNCYADWKTQVDKSYEMWKEDSSYATVDIPAKCFVNSNRSVDRNSFVRLLNPKETNSDFTNPSVLQKLNLPDVSLAQLKEFSKNGLFSESAILPFETKVNILHRMCYLMRTKIVPRNARAYQDEVDASINKEMDNGNFVSHFLTIRATAVPYIRGSLTRRLRQFEEDCHKQIDFFANEIRPFVGKVDRYTMHDYIAVRARTLPFSIERKVRVIDTTNRYIYKDGKTINYSVGTGFSLSNGFNVNRGLKIDPLETAEKVASMGKNPISKGIAGVIGAVGGFLNFTWGENESLAKSNGTSVSSGTTIAGQISTLDIELAKWEKCVVVRFNEKAIVDTIKRFNVVRTDDGDNQNNLPYFYDSSKMQGLGTMFCSGDESTEDDLNPGQKLRVRERYYYFTQIFNEGDMQDPGALFNHPWMLQMRGVRDFTTFHGALTRSDTEINWGSAYGLFASDMASMYGGLTGRKEINLSGLKVVSEEDVERALDMMKEAYSRALPTFPGMYTFSDSAEDEIIQWDN